MNTDHISWNLLFCFSLHFPCVCCKSSFKSNSAELLLLRTKIFRQKEITHLLQESFNFYKTVKFLAHISKEKETIIIATTTTTKNESSFPFEGYVFTNDYQWIINYSKSEIYGFSFVNWHPIKPIYWEGMPTYMDNLILKFYLLLWASTHI